MMEFRVWSLWEQMWTAKRCSDDSKIFFIFGNLFLVMADIHLFLFYPTGSQNNGKHKWEEAEVLAVERQMMRLIQGHKVPQKNDCIQCLEAEPEALRNRSWKGVKDYVRNRITALKRQSGASRATSTNSNLPGQVEPQQSTGQFWMNLFVQFCPPTFFVLHHLTTLCSSLSFIQSSLLQRCESFYPLGWNIDWYFIFSVFMVHGGAFRRRGQ